ncbi:MAG: DUF1192 family protein [Alphaproteobacteria bacterium]|nr:DUF1192 family protein [Alphaproteobacteria bacterium]
MAFNPDELEPQKPVAKPKDLTVMSVGELKDYITELETEIARTRDAIAKKESHRGSVEGLFRR